MFYRKWMLTISFLYQIINLYSNLQCHALCSFQMRNSCRCISVLRSPYVPWYMRICNMWIYKQRRTLTIDMMSAALRSAYCANWLYLPSSYHHQIGSIQLSHCCRIFPWLCVWDGCTIIFCHLLHIYPGNTGTLFLLLMFRVGYLQTIGYIMACRSCWFVCRLHHLIIIIIQTYLKALNY